MEYYTYIAVDLRKPGRFVYNDLSFSFLFEPFYIGKGKGHRWRQTNHKNGHVKNLMKLLGDPSSYTVLFPAEQSKQALLSEQYYITQIGRRDFGTGPLLNLTDGGEGTIGWKMPDDVKHKILSKTRGRKRTSKFCEECRQRSSQRKPSFETKQKVSASLKGKSHGVEYEIQTPKGDVIKIDCLEPYARQNNFTSGTFLRDGKTKGFVLLNKTFSKNSLRSSKINESDKPVLLQLAQQGNSGTDIARYFKVSRELVVSYANRWNILLKDGRHNSGRKRKQNENF